LSFRALFLLGVALDILAGLNGWGFVLAGNLNDPDSYMRLLRIEQGLQAGHLVNIVARDGPAGTLVEWSKLLDLVLIAMAAPLAVFIGWHRALFCAGVALGPLGVGALGTALAYAVEPFTAAEFLYAAPVAAALLPGLSTFAAPGVVHYHTLLLALIALTAGLAVRAWWGERFYGFLSGVAGGFAIWLTPETMPFVLMVYAALLIRWWQGGFGLVLVTTAAGLIDVLGFALAIDPPQGGYAVPEIDRLSIVYVVMGLQFLGGAAAMFQLERRRVARWRSLGLALLALLFTGWVAAFPGVVEGQYGLMSHTDQVVYYGAISEDRPLRGADLVLYLAPAFLAIVYALWQARRGRGRYIWMLVSLYTFIAAILGATFMLFVEFAPCVAAALLPIALADVSLRWQNSPRTAAMARLTILGLVIGLPFVSVVALPAGERSAWTKNVAGSGPACGLHDISVLLDPIGHAVVLANMEISPELLYRTPVETVGSLYHHNVKAFLTARAAWRAVPGVAEPSAVMVTTATYVLFCHAPLRFQPVADLPTDTLWDALERGQVPPWLRLVGTDDQGWRLYRIGSAMRPPGSGAGTPVVPGSDRGKP
jgi:hypothetical protein